MSNAAQGGQELSAVVAESLQYYAVVDLKTLGERYVGKDIDVAAKRFKKGTALGIAPDRYDAIDKARKVAMACKKNEEQGDKQWPATNLAP